MEAVEVYFHAALTFRITQGMTLSVCRADKLAIDEETQKTGMVFQPGLMEKKETVNAEEAKKQSLRMKCGHTSFCLAESSSKYTQTAVRT